MAQMSTTLGSGGKLGLAMPLRWWYPAVAGGSPTPTPTPVPTGTPASNTDTPPLPTDEPKAAAAGAKPQDRSRREPEAVGDSAVRDAVQAMGRDFMRDLTGGGASGGGTSSGSKTPGGSTPGAKSISRGASRRPSPGGIY